MPQFPLRTNVKPYAGNKPALRAKYLAKLDLASRIQDYLNLRNDGKSTQIFTYYEIADELGCETKQVYDILMPVCGGHNGITIGQPT